MLSACDQEMCPNWDGFACPCAVLGIARAETDRRCPECLSAAAHDVWDGWFCEVCDWEENPL